MIVDCNPPQKCSIWFLCLLSLEKDNPHIHILHMRAVFYCVLFFQLGRTAYGGLRPEADAHYEAGRCKGVAPPPRGTRQLPNMATGTGREEPADITQSWPKRARRYHARSKEGGSIRHRRELASSLRPTRQPRYRAMCRMHPSCIRRQRAMCSAHGHNVPRATLGVIVSPSDIPPCEAWGMMCMCRPLRRNGMHTIELRSGECRVR